MHFWTHTGLCWQVGTKQMLGISSCSFRPVTIKNYFRESSNIVSHWNTFCFVFVLFWGDIFCTWITISSVPFWLFTVTKKSKLQNFIFLWLPQIMTRTPHLKWTQWWQWAYSLKILMMSARMTWPTDCGPTFLLSGGTGGSRYRVTWPRQFVCKLYESITYLLNGV